MFPTMKTLILVTLCGYLTDGTPLVDLLEVSEFRTLFLGLDATLETDLVFIGGKPGGGAFTFCFTSAGRECEGSGTGIEARGDVLLHWIRSWITRFQV